MAKPYLATPRSGQKARIDCPCIGSSDPAIQCRQLVRVLQWYLSSNCMGLRRHCPGDPERAAPTRSGDRNNIEELKQRIAENSIPKEGQTGHDDRFGYGILNAPGLIGGEASTAEVGAHIVVEGQGHGPIITTKVAPDNSTKADLNPRSPASRTIRIQSLNASTLS